MKFFGLISITVISFIMPVYSYCVYMMVDIPEMGYKIRQTPMNAGLNYFARFARSDLKSGEKACCPYTNSDCVRSGGQNDKVQIAYRRHYNGLQEFPSVVDVPGGGWVEIHGDADHELILSFNPDGTSYDGNPRVDLQAGEN
ncbi:uncharacterized protein B0P05DRAFT_642281 [Gilbertella persicaria]|uniref:uncharacterized protein n=1 Tax=Gilbertella persicaria TaxID=101096 RepID=UPI00221F5817|nr:uncharacterized protein B0P05DRAFT_642281 [Gilbertella persicaria]KAI8047523.1 hypothetical protein B0P05DRAFT_642281 [Gilbertella persicaria]